MTSMTIPGGAAAAHGEGRLRHGGHVDLYPWCPRRGRDPGAEACTVAVVSGMYDIQRYNFHIQIMYISIWSYN